MIKVFSNFSLFLAAIILGAVANPASCANGPNEPNQAELLENRIEELKAVKRGFEARALRAENQGQRLQFQNENYLEARRYFKIADQYRKKADAIQKEIDRLESLNQS